MKRSEMLETRLAGPLDAIQMCRDIVEGNFNAMLKEEGIDRRHAQDGVDPFELQARIYTDLEILAMNQQPKEPSRADKYGI